MKSNIFAWWRRKRNRRRPRTASAASGFRRVLPMAAGALVAGALSLGAGQQARAIHPYLQSFESNADFYSSSGAPNFSYTPVAHVSSGGGFLGYPSSYGTKHIEITNTPDNYGYGFGSFGYDYFGGPNSTYNGDFYQAVDIYVDPGAWTLGSREFTYTTEIFWLDMSPRNSVSGVSDFGSEHNFRFNALGGNVVGVYRDANPIPLAIFTPSEEGWYSFVIEYSKTGNLNTTPVNIDMIIYKPDGSIMGGAFGVGSSQPSGELGGNSYMWFTVVNDGYGTIGDVLAIDNIRSDLLPFVQLVQEQVLPVPEPGTGLLVAAACGMIAPGVRRRRRQQQERQT